MNFTGSDFYYSAGRMARKENEGLSGPAPTRLSNQPEVSRERFHSGYYRYHLGR